jgi:hypothetical protein
LRTRDHLQSPDEARRAASGGRDRRKPFVTQEWIQGQVQIEIQIRYRYRYRKILTQVHICTPDMKYSADKEGNVPKEKVPL